MVDEVAPVGADVRAVARECCDVLRGAVDADWDVAVPDLDWTVAEVVAHAAEGCLWYAIDLAAAGRDLTAVEHRVAADHEPDELIATVGSYARLVSWVVDAAPADSRGYHPMGAADPSGFAAMACDELLIHTDDAARGLGVVAEPDVRPWAVRRYARGRGPAR